MLSRSADQTTFNNLLKSKQKAGTAPRLLPLRICWFSSLPPVPFPHFPVVVHTNPAVSNPMCAGVRRTIPVAGGPDVLAAVPTVKSIDPHIATVRRWPTTLNNGRRWSYANHNLRIRRRRHQCKSKQQCQCNFFHDESCPPGVLSFRNSTCGPARCTSERDSAGIVAFQGWCDLRNRAPNQPSHKSAIR